MPLQQLVPRGVLIFEGEPLERATADGSVSLPVSRLWSATGCRQRVITFCHLPVYLGVSFGAWLCSWEELTQYVGVGAAVFCLSRWRRGPVQPWGQPGSCRVK